MLVNEPIYPSGIISIASRISSLGGFSTIFICTEVLPVQLSKVPVTVYIVVSEGEAKTGFPVVELNPSGGLHMYSWAPIAVKAIVYLNNSRSKLQFH